MARTVVVTREAGYNDELRSLIPATWQVAEVPLTATTYVPHDEVASAVTSLSDPCATLVVTSVRAGDYLDVVRPALADPVEVATVGETCRAMLEARGFEVTHQSGVSAADLAPRITRGPVLMLGARDLQPALPQSLRDKGLEVAHIVCYATTPVTLSAHDKSVVAAADVLVIAAPSAWRVVASVVRPTTLVVVPGVTTRDAVAASHENVAIAWGSDLTTLLSA